MKLSPKRFFRRNKNAKQDQNGASGTKDRYETELEVRPGGMLVQKRAERNKDQQCMIHLKVSTVYQCHHISIRSTSTFGEMKLMLSLVTGLWPREQRLIFKGKEREDTDQLHIIGVQNQDKVLLFEDPALKERKLRSSSLAQLMGVPCHSFTRV
ncbi:hypothetical protein LUZ60_002122 [Juncus effusus]|nr:hypothetical protein LUZ60_002122 [Juncus effusus]